MNGCGSILFASIIRYPGVGELELSGSRIERRDDAKWYASRMWMQSEDQPQGPFETREDALASIYCISRKWAPRIPATVRPEEV